jgi:hypothetical protein
LRNRILVLVVFCGLAALASAQDSAQSSFGRYTFNFGGGPGIGRGIVSSFVGNSWQATAGAGYKINRLFSVDAEYMYYDLELRPSVSKAQSLPDATGRLQSVSLDGIVNVPRHIGKFGAYGIFGAGFDDRSVSTHTQLLEPGTLCQQTYARWWGIDCVVSNPTFPYGSVNGVQTLSSYSRVAGSYNFGGGITRQLESWHHAKVYLEYRYHHAYQADAETIVWPITVGLRW